MTCTSESSLFDRATAARTVTSEDSEPSVARRIFLKMLIGSLPRIHADQPSAKAILTTPGVSEGSPTIFEGHPRNALKIVAYWYVSKLSPCRLIADAGELVDAGGECSWYHDLGLKTALDRTI